MRQHLYLHFFGRALNSPLLSNLFDINFTIARISAPLKITVSRVKRTSINADIQRLPNHIEKIKAVVSRIFGVQNFKICDLENFNIL